MKILAIILSAGVVAGLAAYAVLMWCKQIALHNNEVVMGVSTFVMTLAGTGFGAAGMALVFRAGFVRGDGTGMQKLEERIARLEGSAPR